MTRGSVAIALVAVAAIVSACTSDGDDASTSVATTPAAATTDAPTDTPTDTEPATTIAAAATVRMTGLWSGPELDAFEAVVAPWEAANGIDLVWEPSRDLERDLAAGGDDLPEVAVLPNPGLLHRLAADGVLQPLDELVDPAVLSADYTATWLDLTSHDGVHYGIPYKVTDKSTVWYDPAAFTAAGYEVPTTWDELLALADRVVADGGAPFSVVAPKSPAAGWALTDWVSQLVLAGCGVDVFDRWVAAEVPWTDPCIRQAFERFGVVVGTPGYVAGGIAAIAATTDAAGVDPLFADPPGAYLYPMASFAQLFVQQRFPDLVAGDDYATFRFPAIDAATPAPTMVGADIVVALDDTPAVRSLLAYLEGADAQLAWIEIGGFTSVNRTVPLDAYPDPVSQAVAADLVDATEVRFGAGDLMPAALQRAWWQAMLRFVDDPTRLDPILDSLTETASATAT